MLRRNGCGYVLGACPNEIHTLFCRDVFENDFQVRKSLGDVSEVTLDKYRLTIKDIYVLIGHFTMHLQHHPNLFHGCEDSVHAA